MPHYTAAQQIRADKENFDAAIANYDKAEKKKNELLALRNTIKPVNLERIEKMIPDNVDNIRLLLDMQGIASRYNMSIANIKVGDEGKSGASAGSGVTLGPSSSGLGTVALSFSTVTNYENLQKFLKDIEKSLRIVEVKSLDVKGGTQPNVYQVGITLNLFWLKGQNAVSTQTQ
jgi:hypothetical protein